MAYAKRKTQIIEEEKLTPAQRKYKALMESSASPAVIVRSNLAKKYYEEGDMVRYRIMLKLK
ncbi:hypothetical protein PCY12_08070 [Streptococcus sp. SPS1]|uniref:hypothetical protein n=1 Tax=Streptococcus sp. SPS1 TaxID=3018247 RepID=UPI00263C1A32|nr:hypothetical protein [Streptococcus sp. SPS1]MDN5027261.1 hypothetical protein [Streptococcus sp. SPS1]